MLLLVEEDMIGTDEIVRGHNSNSLYLSIMSLFTVNKQPTPVSIKQLDRVFETLPPKYEVEITYSDKTKEKKAVTAKCLITSYGVVLSNSQYNHFALAAQRDEDEEEEKDQRRRAKDAPGAESDDDNTCFETTITLPEHERPPKVIHIEIHKGRLESLPLKFPVTVYYDTKKPEDIPMTAKQLLMDYGHMLTKPLHDEAMRELIKQLEWEELRRQQTLGHQ